MQTGVVSKVAFHSSYIAFARTQQRTPRRRSAYRPLPINGPLCYILSVPPRRNITNRRLIFCRVATKWLITSELTSTYIRSGTSILNGLPLNLQLPPLSHLWSNVLLAFTLPRAFCVPYSSHPWRISVTKFLAMRFLPASSLPCLLLPTSFHSHKPPSILSP
jgi:hypothetical protein